LVTEGSDDYTLFRHLNDDLGFGDCLPAGNKDAVLKLCADHAAHSCPRIAYLVDRDLWSVNGLPKHVASLPNLIITDGYSIENDLLRDHDPERLIYDIDRSYYDAQLELLIKWFAAGITARGMGREFDFDRKISYVCAERAKTYTLEAQADVLSHNPPQALIDDIRADYPRLLRGKTWLSLLSRFLNYNGRAVHHNPKAMLEAGLRSRGQHSTALLHSLRTALS
jgi:hypothetical protein